MPTTFVRSIPAIVAAAPGSPTVGLGPWLLALAPVVLLLALVLWGRLSTWWNALITVAAALLLGGLVFGADLPTLLVGTAKGA